MAHGDTIVELFCNDAERKKVRRVDFCATHVCEKRVL